MSFTNLSYDDCEYKSELKYNVSALNYMFDPVKFYNPNKCMNALGLVAGSAVSHVNGNLVDLESNLMGIDREASKCPSMYYTPNDDNVAIGANYYRQVPTNIVDTTKSHLPQCQIFNTHPVPYPTSTESFNCHKTR